MTIKRYGIFPLGKYEAGRGESSREVKNRPFPSKTVDLRKYMFEHFRTELIFGLLGHKTSLLGKAIF